LRPRCRAAGVGDYELGADRRKSPDHVPVLPQGLDWKQEMMLDLQNVPHPRNPHSPRRRSFWFSAKTSTSYEADVALESAAHPYRAAGSSSCATWNIIGWDYTREAKTALIVIQGF
jgi:hypothetical protein